MRVLIVSYYFPPAAGGGVQRVLKWAKYLPQHGIEVHVLTPDDPKWLDSDGGLEVPDGTIVHRSRNLSPRSIKPSEQLAGVRGIRRALRKAALLPRRLLVPDIHVGWSLSAVRAGRRIVREHEIDLIISTSPPETDHLIAAKVARRTGVPWIADYRDSWLDLPHLRTDRMAVRLKHAHNTRLATRIMGRAAAATTVSEPLAVDLRRRHSHLPVHVIPNGVDLDDLRDLPTVRDADDRSFLIVYTGNFFGRQSPQTFLRGLQILLERRPDLLGKVTVRLIGGMKPVDHDLIESDGLLNFTVRRIDFLPYREVLAWQAAAQLLFLYVAPGPGSAGVYTGKVFEYVASGRPTLALAPADNVAARLITETRSGIVVEPDDEDAIANAILLTFDAWKVHGTTKREVKPEVLTRISREGQAAQLAELVRATLKT